MPLLRPSPSDFTAVVKALANAGAAVSNPQGSRPPSKGGVAFVNVSTVAAMIRGSPRLVSILPRASPVLASLATPVAPIDPNYTTYDNSLVINNLQFIGGYFTRDASGNFYGRKYDYKYYKISPTGVETFLAGDGNTGNGVFTPGLGAAARFGGTGGVRQPVLDSSGNLFTVHEQTHRIIKIAPNGNVTSFAGTGSAGTGDGPAATAAFYYPIGIAIDASNTLYVSESYRKTIRKITSSGQVSTLTFSSVFDPYFYGLAVDSTGVLYGLEPFLHRVYKIIPTGPASADIALLAGSTQGIVNGQGSAARFSFEQTSGITVDTFGNVYVGDSTTEFRKITPNGTTATIVVMGAGDRVRTPIVDRNGVVYVSTDVTIRKISPLIASLANAEGGSNDVFVVKYNSDGIPLWARRLGGTLSDSPNSVSTDSSGNIVVAGRYASNPLTIYNADGTTFTTLANAGGNDSFVVKYNSDGTPQWATRVGGTGNDNIFSVTTDSSGNIIVAGVYASNPLTIYNADGTTFTTLANAGGQDVFVVKYNSDGTPQWVRRLSGTGSENNISMSTDSSGNIVVNGIYNSNPLTIYNGYNTTETTAFTLTTAGGGCIFLVKYASDGTPLWVRRVGGTGVTELSSISIDSNGNIIIGGYYNGSPIIYNGYNTTETTEFTLTTSVGSFDIFVAKYTSDGRPLWARRMGGTAFDFPNYNSISTDSSGNIIVTGEYRSNPLTIYNADGTGAFTLANDGERDGFLVKYASDGTPRWATRVGGSGTNSGRSVRTDSTGNIIICGYYNGSPIIYNADGTTFTTLADNGSTDVFVVKYNSDGTPLWANRFGGTTSENANSISTDSSGNIIMTGEYYSNPLPITVG